MYKDLLNEQALDEIIRKKGNKYCLLSKKSKKNLGCYNSKSKAKKRERQVQYFKNVKKQENSAAGIGLSGAPAANYKNNTKKEKNMEDLKLLREHIRDVLRTLKKKQKYNFIKEKLEEFKLRKMIRSLIKEAEDIPTHESTGINVLADLLETIVPILKSFYKKLGTDIEQRKSFRAHTIKAVQNLLSPIAVMYKAGGTVGGPPTAQGRPEVPEQEVVEEAKKELREKVKVSKAEEDPAFIPLEKDKKAQEETDEPPKPEDAFQPIPEEDETGRNIALQSFKRIEKQIREAYSLLANEDDRNLFYDYLVTNLKLYFDKFEDELQAIVPEPTTQAYEAEKARKQGSLGVPSAGTATPPAGETSPAAPAPVPANLPPAK